MKREIAEIRTFRKALGWSQKDLAARLGVHFDSVSRWERGDIEPKPQVWLALEALSQASEPEKRATK